jgi:tetratricopeptide (TPR) repeat protein
MRTKLNNAIGSRWLGPLLVACAFASLPDSSLGAGSQGASSASACAGSAAQLQAAARAIDQGALGEAGRLLTPLESLYPQCSELFLCLARLHAAQKDTVTAQELFSHSIDLAPQDARSYYYFAQFYLSGQQYQQADYFSDQAVSRNAAYPDALILRGQILAMKGQPAAAREMLEKACKLVPTNPEAHFQLGVLFDGRQLHPEAVEQFEKVIALRPADARAFDYLALNLESLGETHRAESAYQTGLKVNEGPLSDAFLEFNYGRFLMKGSRLAESKVYLDRALRAAPNTRAVCYEHGKLNMRLQNYKEAQVDAERALSLGDPSGFVLDLQVYYLLATIYSRLGNTELAQKYAALCRTSGVPLHSQGRGDR